MSSFNPGGPPPPKKETVYGGPDPFAVSSSSSPSPQGAAPAMKKETVYGQTQPAAYGQPTPPPPAANQENVFGGSMPNNWQQQPAAVQAANSAGHAAAMAMLARSASWFFWIAGLSLINTFTMMSGTNFVFIAGLGITAILGAMAHAASNNAIQAVAIVISLIAAGIFAGLGLAARKGAQWAFILGMIFYVLDTGIALLIQDWLMALFHGYVLYRLWIGFSSCRKLEALGAEAY